MEQMFFNYQRLISARKACKFTQAQVACALGLDRSTYTNYELGKTTPSYKSLAKIAKMFNTDASWFIMDDEREMNSPSAVFEEQSCIKEKNMLELGKDERAVLAMYRSSKALNKSDDVILFLQGICGE